MDNGSLIQLLKLATWLEKCQIRNLAQLLLPAASLIVDISLEMTHGPNGAIYLLS